MRDFNGLIVFLSTMCPKNFTRVKKKCDLSGADLSGDTSSKYVIAFFFNISGQKILLMKAEKAAGPMDIP